MDEGSAARRCETCGLPITISKRRRELLELVASGNWHDVSDNDIGRLEALDRDGLIRWVDYRPTEVGGGVYRITERGREVLEAA
jgi:hypothetical protein